MMAHRHFEELKKAENDKNVKAEAKAKEVKEGEGILATSKPEEKKTARTRK